MAEQNTHNCLSSCFHCWFNRQHTSHLFCAHIQTNAIDDKQVHNQSGTRRSAGYFYMHTG